MSEGAGTRAPVTIPGLTRLFVSSLPALILQVIIQRPEYNKRLHFKLNAIFNLLILVIWTLRYFITEFLISEKFMNTIEKIF